MSYPRHLQTLIVEDEQEPIENYRNLFEEFAKKGLNVAPPVFARSHDDAIKLLSTSSIFHLVIVDLGLPNTAHEPALAGVELGIHIVQQAAARDEYPIPALLVISGRLGQAHLSALTDSLKRDFWHGDMVNKGDMDLDEAIACAVRKAQDYCDVGIHLRDVSDKLCPTLSPREDDLLRRCVLTQPLCIGLDLEWWGVSKGYSFSPPSAATGMTKVLMGRFLLRDGKESSRPSFFKFEAKERATCSHQAVAVLVQKLSHVKLCSAMISLSRGLLVTQQVGGSSARPISLAELLGGASEKADVAIPRIVSDIVGQLGNLGTATEDRFAVSTLLWQWHDLEKIKAACLRHGGDLGSRAIQLLEKLRVSNKELWVNRQSCTHGDLNATNIAIEVVEDGYRAYIFDAEGIQADTAIRDLAMLETTLLLHQRNLPPGMSLVEECKAVYATGVSVPKLVPTENPPLVQNSLKLIREIRHHVLQKDQIQPYALMVFDCAMLQLGGLAVQSRGNRIANPQDAVRLAELAASWLVSLAPEITA
jgi:CheY-like chemotaxis protein